MKFKVVRKCSVSYQVLGENGNLYAAHPSLSDALDHANALDAYERIKSVPDTTEQTVAEMEAVDDDFDEPMEAGSSKGDGQDLRDTFAVSAMNAFLMGRYEALTHKKLLTLSKNAYMVADSMMKARKGRK